MSDDRWFEQLATMTDVATGPESHAPATLKSKIYSSVVKQMAAGGRLLSLATTKAEGRKLCVFEDVLALLPVGEALREKNPCRVCHARLLGEHVDRAPIFWPGCPYSDFHHS